MSTLGRWLIVGIGLSEGVRLTGWRACLRLSEEGEAPPEVVAARVRAVEREPELVPGVRRVTILERRERTAVGARSRTALGELETRVSLSAALARLREADAGAAEPDGWVRYVVEGRQLGLPWEVRFSKAWWGDERFAWAAEAGTGCPQQQGQLRLLPQDGGTRLELEVWTRSALPVVGGLATLLVNPLFLAPTFGQWLRNLGAR
jgi:hypothetical protein